MNGRAYQQSHPWITFTVDLRPAAAQVWSLLGQVVARCEQIVEAALPPAVAAEMYRIYLSKGARATTAIEGNTLSEAQVRARLEGQLELPLSQEYLGREVDNILHACTAIWRELQRGARIELAPQLIADYNRRVLSGLEAHLDDGVVPGEIPTHRVTVGRYRGAPREDCPYLLARLCEWIEQEPAPAAFLPGAAQRIAIGVLRAVLAHLYLAWIHPFGDGNGRTARLVEFLLLARAGVPAPAAQLLSNHYHQTRTEYYRQLDRSSRVNAGRGDAVGFVCYALQGFADGLREQCAYVEGAQLRIAWEHLVYQTFGRERPSPAHTRRQLLLLALGTRQEPVPRAAIADLTPTLARRYAGKTAKTLTRDLNWLLQHDLIRREPGGYRAQVERMRSFQPGSRYDAGA